MLIYHQQGPVTFMSVSFHEKYLSHQSSNLAWKLLSKLSFQSPRGQCVNTAELSQHQGCCWCPVSLQHQDNSYPISMKWYFITCFVLVWFQDMFVVDKCDKSHLSTTNISWNHTKTKHNKTVYIVHGIYFILCTAQGNVIFVQVMKYNFRQYLLNADILKKNKIIFIYIFHHYWVQLIENLPRGRLRPIYTTSSILDMNCPGVARRQGISSSLGVDLVLLC